MNTTDTPAISSDEKLIGAAAHFFGPLAATILWVTQKDKSRFVKFQTLQALAFDLVIVTATGVLFFCVFGIMFLGMFASLLAMMRDPSSQNEFLFLLPATMFPVTIFACIFPFSFVITVARLVASVSILGGRNYRYPFIGKWLEKFMEN